MAEIRITSDNYENEVTASSLPVLLDFWATWCGPCMMLAPVLAEIAEEYDGKITVGKVNVDEEPELAGAFSVSSIPTLVLMKNGKPIDQMIGFHRKEDILLMLGL